MYGDDIGVHRSQNFGGNWVEIKNLSQNVVYREIL